MLNSNYKLYRNLNDIFHPSISRKNITNYEIILDEEIVPLKIYYPKIDTKLEKAIIYIHSNDIDDYYYDALSMGTNNVVIVLKYTNDSLNDCSKALNYIYDEIIKHNLSIENFSIMSDFNGTDIIFNMIDLLNNDNFINMKKILISPKNIELENIDLKNTYVLSNHDEIKVGEVINLYKIKESLYDFIKYDNSYEFEKIINVINDILEME